MSVDRTALVTGGAGFIGRRVAAQLQSAGWTVVTAGRGCAVEAISCHALATLRHEIALAVHCAGGASVAKSIGDPSGEFANSVPPTVELLEFIRRHHSSANVVLVSSGAVYGQAASLPTAETAPTQPVSPYGLHKLVTEDIGRFYGRAYGMRVAIVRLFSVYGEGLRKQLLWDASRKAVVGDLIFSGTGNEVRDWLHVSDAASLITLVGGSASPEAPVFNGGSGTGSTVATVLEHLFRALGVSGVAKFSGVVRAGDPTSFVADIRRAAALGWVPRIALDEGINAYARWFREHG
jgi:UDP-glucose 4-epimerase